MRRRKNGGEQRLCSNYCSYIANYCIVLYCIVLNCIVLYCIAVLRCITSCCMMMDCDSSKSQRIEIESCVGGSDRIEESTHLQALCLGELSVQLQPPASQRADE
jgi:hypothetical protein